MSAGSREEVSQLSLLVKTETPAAAAAAPPAGPPPSRAAVSPSPAEQRASPPSSSLPFGSVTIKQEPLSPVRIKSEPDLADGTSICAHSTTPELQGTGGTAAAASPPGIRSAARQDKTKIKLGSGHCHVNSIINGQKK